MFSLQQAETLARTKFGISELRAPQREALSALADNRDVLVVLPTGGGKSLCYQLPSQLLPGVTLVVSPLIALMADQVRSLVERGINAVMFSSAEDRNAQEDSWRMIEGGNVKIIFIAPERFASEKFWERISEITISLLAIDEAHCISEWGHDFRPSYRAIGNARSRLGMPLTIALTATATRDVQEDIIRELTLRKPKKIIAGFDRPNLRYAVLKNVRKEEALLNVARGVGGVGIVYVTTRNEVEPVMQSLNAQGFQAAGYHAGLSASERKRVQENFFSEEVQAIVATTAFGMGIDKPNIRWVVHYRMPQSLEGYYQESGRAGRDGQTSYAALLYDTADRTMLERMIDLSFPSRETLVHAMKIFRSAMRPDGILPITARTVAEKLKTSEYIASRILALAEQKKIISTLPRSEQKGSIMLNVSRADIESGRMFGSKERLILEALLRQYGAMVLQEECQCNVRELLRRREIKDAGYDEKKISQTLTDLAAKRYLLYTPPLGTDVYKRDDRWSEEASEAFDIDALERRRKHAFRKLAEVEKYALVSACRNVTLLRYFGQQHAQNCGRCDQCTSKRKRNRSWDTLEQADREKILTVLRCVRAFDGVFGEETIADILVGLDNPRAQEQGFIAVKEFGAFRSSSRTIIRERIEQAIAVGLIRRNTGGTSVLECTVKGYELSGDVIHV